MTNCRKIQLVSTLTLLTLLNHAPYTMSGEQTISTTARATIAPEAVSLSKLLHMSVPPSHTALSGDLHVQIHGTWPLDTSTLQLHLSRLDGSVAHVLYTTTARPDARTLGNSASSGNVSQNSNGTAATVLRLPCGLFSKGGEYYVELVRIWEGNRTQDEDDDDDDKLVKGLDVRWPLPRLSLTPEHVQTYPESPVTAILEFPEVMCPPVVDNAPSAIPEFWLELHYCGHSLLTCDNGNQSHSVQVLYSEQIRGFPGRRIVTLRCELFGLAGHYALLLRPTTSMPSLSNTAAYVKADWSEQFVFNVHARSILPCDVHSGGVTVLFQYPSCILSSGDRVRLFARLRADVGSLAPPTSLEYVAERRVVRGQHALHFDCELFSERYIEYCFVYVSQAITGAVADVRMDCVPTLPVSESESGGWGAWSAWTACSSTCSGGTRNRYRFCDSPPPRYGAKFCEGAAVQTEKCGGSNEANDRMDWDCVYGGNDGNAGIDIAPIDRPEVLAEVGPGCRCGCVVHLGLAKPRRLLATSSHSCPGRTFWLIQADEEHAVRFKVDHFRLPCSSQWLKVRDGNSLSGSLLAQLTGGERRASSAPAAVQSSGPHLLLEFFSDELMAGGEACGGGFLAHAQQVRLLPSNASLPSSASASISSAATPGSNHGSSVVGVATGGRLTAVHAAALLLASVVLVATALLAAQYVLRYRKYHIAEDMDSLADSNGSIAVRARVSSSATLLSEVISLTRLRPPAAHPRHTRLRESLDVGDAEQEMVDDDESHLDVEYVCEDTNNVTKSSEQIATSGDVNKITAPPTTVEDTTNAAATKGLSLTLKEIPNTTLVRSNNENELTSSQTLNISLNQRQVQRLPTSKGMASSNGNPSAEITSSTNSTSSNETSKSNGTNFSTHRTNTSCGVARVNGIPVSVNLTNGCYSPPSSMTSKATIRSTNPKESKEKRNREKLLAGPVGSEFSIAGADTDLELDYYDYNVVNAGAIPGSFLGMDPQYLVWIPPLDEGGEILKSIEKSSYEYEDIRPKQFIDPGSNQESPEDDLLLPEERRSSFSGGTYSKSPIIIKRRVKQTKIDASDLNETNTVKDLPPILKRMDYIKYAIPLKEFPKNLGINSPAKVHKVGEKETKVEKSPSGYNLDDIKFVDEECDEDENNAIGNINTNNDTNSINNIQCMKPPYQDSNIITSSKS